MYSNCRAVDQIWPRVESFESLEMTLNWRAPITLPSAYVGDFDDRSRATHRRENAWVLSDKGSPRTRGRSVLKEHTKHDA